MTPDPSRSGTPPRQPLFNNLPVVVLALGAAIVCVTLAQFAAPPRREDWMFAVGALAGGPGYDNVYRPWGPLAPLVLHVFLHGGWLHLGMNMAAMASFGPGVAMALGRGARGAILFLAFFFLCAIGGGIAQMLAFTLLGAGGVAIGASSALSGLLPALGWITGGYAGALRLSAPWVLINVALAVTGMAFPLPIAWAAHLGGLAAGLVLFPLFLRLAGWRRSPWG